MATAQPQDVAVRLGSLPAELIIKIMANGLTALDCCRFASTCLLYADLTRGEYFWKFLCENCSQAPSNDISWDPISAWKVRFLMRFDGMGLCAYVISKILSQEHLEGEILRAMLLHASRTLSGEPNVVRLPAPVTVVGDIHGQLADLLHVFSRAGKPPNTSFLFLGDYVNRGHFSIEVSCLLLAMKVKYPKHVYLLRGNHECRQISQVHGFYDDCVQFYDLDLWKAMHAAFDHLPLAAIVGEKIFCVHGGLSPEVTTLKQIDDLIRCRELAAEGPIIDLLWSDPEDIDGWGISPRGAGYLWGAEVTQKFLASNDLTVMIRAHQLMSEGYGFQHDKQCVTVFSASNYCYRVGNRGAILKISEDLKIEPETYYIDDEERHKLWSKFPLYNLILETPYLL